MPREDKPPGGPCSSELGALNKILERLGAIEELLQEQREHRKEREARRRRKAAAASLIAGNDVAHDN